jgi:predicted NodU family carbamoyl transferase
VNIIGISAPFHDSACCLLRDGVLVAAAQEERFSRVKNDPRFPVRAFRYCLEAGGVDIVDIDCVAYCEYPVRRVASIISGPPMGGASTNQTWEQTLPSWIARPARRFAPSRPIAKPTT